MTNKEIVTKFYDEVFNAWDTSKLDEYMLPSHKQHNPTVDMGINKVCDIYRLENGMLAEHWDVVQHLDPEQVPANDNGQF